MNLTKTISAAALTVGAATGLLAGGPATAVPMNMIYTVYYSDATYTEEVGEKYLSCQGKTFIYGVVTAYKIVTTEGC